jgi:thiamine thiazole synthase
MSPPVAAFENPTAVLGNVKPMAIKKDLAVQPAAGGQEKVLAEIENNWEAFTFAPIRESQVSRAMSMSSTLGNLQENETDIVSPPLLQRPRHVRRV